MDFKIIEFNLLTDPIIDNIESNNKYYIQTLIERLYMNEDSNLFRIYLNDLKRALLLSDYRDLDIIDDGGLSNNLIIRKLSEQ